ncbi:MAG: PTS system mannose/fructose/N-acetylgalactosamine-transporter subunit IIB [Lachnospiraceae bacterium]
MAEIYVRIDDRLIHGQTIIAWCPTLQIKEIIAIDDVSALNPMLKTVMTMGVPGNYKTHIVTTKEAKELLKSPSAVTRLVIVKQPTILDQLGEELSGIKSIILGNLAKKEDSKYKLDGATGIFYLSDEDVKILDELSNEGMDIYFQQLPATSKTGWEAFKKTI